MYLLFLTGIQCTYYTINQNEIGVQEGHRQKFQSLVPDQTYTLQLVNINFENVLMTQNVKKYVVVHQYKSKSVLTFLVLL